MRFFLLIALIVMSCAGSAKAEDSCAYCGVWLPWRASSVSIHSNDKILIEPTKITVPHCKPFAIKQLNRGDILPNFNIPGSIEFEVESLSCDFSIPNASGKFLVQLSFGAFRENSQLGMNLSIYGNNSTNSGQRHEHASWSTMRSKQESCDDGSSGLSNVCILYMLIEADDNLNQAWQKMIGVASAAARPDYIKGQNTWLKNTRNLCELNHKDDGAGQWPYFWERECVLNAFEQRVKDFNAIQICLKQQTRNCPLLSQQPYPEVEKGE